MKQGLIGNLGRYLNRKEDPRAQISPTAFDDQFSLELDESAIVQLTTTDEKYRPTAVRFGSIEVPIDHLPDALQDIYHFALPPVEHVSDEVVVCHGAGKAAVQISEVLIERCPASMDELIAIARRFEIEKKYSHALACANTILAIDPANFDGNFRKGRILEKNGLQRDAKVFSLRAFDERPGHFRPATTLGRIAMKERQFDLALYYYGFVSERQDTYVEACTMTAKALSHLDRTFEAIEYLERAIAHSPKQWKIRRDAAHLMAKAGLLDEAIEMYEGLVVNDGADVARDLNAAHRRKIRSTGATPAIRYRGAFGANREICICCGQDSEMIEFVQTMAEKIGAWTDCSVDVRHGSSADEQNSGSVTTKDYECCLILPEALLNRDFEIPTSVLRFSYLNDNSLEDARSDTARCKYENWIRQIFGR